MDILADNQLRDWLLHRLDPEQAATVDEHMMADDVVVDRLLDVRADLFDDYARGNLDAETRDALQRHWLATPADRDRLALAVGLAKLRAAKTRSRGRTWAVGALAASVALAAGITLLRHTDNTTRTSTSASNVLPTIALRASVHRGAESVDVELPSGDALRLQMEIEHPASDTHYTVRIMDGNAPVFQAAGLSARQAGPIEFIEATLPTASMGPGQRRIVVTDERSSATVQTWMLATHKAN